jgi:anti-sigma regulatory factor (Ser/Thr protein kinase)
VKSITIAADLSEIDRVRQYLQDRLRGLAVSEEDFFKIELSLVEMCVNIIRYAFPEGRGEISIGISRDESRVIIEIRDSGRPFDPRQVPKPEMDEVVAAGQKGGLGIYLTRQLMDEFEYRREDGQNILTIIKRI